MNNSLKKRWKICPEYLKSYLKWRSDSRRTRVVIETLVLLCCPDSFCRSLWVDLSHNRRVISLNSLHYWSARSGSGSGSGLYLMNPHQTGAYRDIQLASGDKLHLSITSQLIRAVTGPSKPTDSFQNRRRTTSGPADGCRTVHIRRLLKELHQQKQSEADVVAYLQHVVSTETLDAVSH